MVLISQDASVYHPEPVERENRSECEKPEANAKFHLISMMCAILRAVKAALGPIPHVRLGQVT